MTIRINRHWFILTCVCTLIATAAIPGCFPTRSVDRFKIIRFDGASINNDHDVQIARLDEGGVETRTPIQLPRKTREGSGQSTFSDAVLVLNSNELAIRFEGDSSARGEVFKLTNNRFYLLDCWSAVCYFDLIKGKRRKTVEHGEALGIRSSACEIPIQYDVSDSREDYHVGLSVVLPPSQIETIQRTMKPRITGIIVDTTIGTVGLVGGVLGPYRINQDGNMSRTEKALLISLTELVAVPLVLVGYGLGIAGVAAYWKVTDSTDLSDGKELGCPYGFFCR